MPSKDAAMVRMGINLGSPEEEAKAKHEMGMKLTPAWINLFVYLHVSI